MAIELVNAQSLNILYTLAQQVNEVRELSVGSSVHFTKTSGPSNQATQPATEVPITVATANQSDLPTGILLANEIKRVINLHFADTLGHDTAVSAAIATADASDQTTLNALLNAIKAAYNTHRSEANVHPNNDGGNAVSSADATDLSTSQTLNNEIKTDLNAHMALSMAGAHVSLIQA
jgi:hypothetical protein